MKTFKIENAPTSFFESKEQYLNFRQAWKNNFKNGKPVCELSSSNYLIYAALRGRDISKCFTPITNINKITCSGMTPYTSYLDAMRSLATVKYYKEELNATKPRAWVLDSWKKQTEKLLAPFDGTITLDMLIKLSDMLVTPDKWEDKA